MAWSSIHGQPLAIRMLREHLGRGRVSQAYLFLGPEGVGKRLAAWELARALNCQAQAEPGAAEPAEACDRCPSCARITRKVHPDVHEVVAQGAAELIRIEEIRQLLGRVALRPYMARVQVGIIDGADRFTEEAANSLLKGLEEPSPHTVFVLITSQPARCLPTVLSRCQPIRFGPLAAPVIEALLVEGGRCAADAAGPLARLAQGSLARAMEMTGDWPAYEAMREHLRRAGFGDWAAWTPPNDREQLGRWLALSIAWLRDLALAASGNDRLIGHADPETMSRQARQLGAEPCAVAALELAQLYDSLDRMANPRLVGGLLRERWLDLLRPT